MQSPNASITMTKLHRSAEDMGKEYHVGQCQDRRWESQAHFTHDLPRMYSDLPMDFKMKREAHLFEGDRPLDQVFIGEQPLVMGILRRKLSDFLQQAQPSRIIHSILDTTMHHTVPWFI